MNYKESVTIMANKKVSTTAVKIHSTLGSRLYDLRTAKKISQTQVAKELKAYLNDEYTANTISSYEKGRRQPPLDTLVALAKFFDTSVDYLLGLDTEEKKKKIENLLASENTEEEIKSPLLSFDTLINPRDYERYNGLPVYVKTKNNEPIFKSKWGLLDYYNKKVIFVGSNDISIEASPFELYRLNPVISSTLELSGIFPLNRKLLDAQDGPFWVEMINTDAEAKALYDGYYIQSPSVKNRIINEANGLTLPKTGLAISFMAYGIKK